MTSRARTREGEKRSNGGAANHSVRRQQQRAAKRPDRERTQSGLTETGQQLLRLQQHHGNQAVQRLVAERTRPDVRSRPSVGRQSDRYEREADRVAARVVRGPASTSVTGPSEGAVTTRVQRLCPRCLGRLRRGESLDCDDCETKLQRTVAGLRPDDAPPPVGEVLRSPGRPLDPATRRFMEERFGHDFSQVRIHTGTRAATSARAVNALAYTVGRDVVFGASAYAPTTRDERELLAHELAHTIQQRRTKTEPPPDPRGRLESSADAAGRTVARGGAVSRELPASGVGVQRAAAPSGAYDDWELAEEIQRVIERLKKSQYEGRDRDLDLLFRLRAVAADRAKARTPASAPPPKPVPPSPPPEDPAIARAAAVEQALAVAESVTGTLADAEDERDDPVTEGAPAHRGTAFSTPHPGALSDDDIEREYREASEWIDEQITRERELSRIPYETRLNRARASLGRSERDYRKLSAEDVWDSGFQRGLFTEGEKEAVYADQNAMRERARKKRTTVNKQGRRNFEIQQYRRHVARGEQLSDPRQILQPFAFGALGPVAAAAYAGTHTGAMVGETVNACRNGTAEECAAAAARLAADVAVQRTVHRATRREPVPGVQNEPRTTPSTRTSSTSGPSTITETLTSPSTTIVQSVPLAGTPRQTATRTPSRRIVPDPVAKGDPAVGSQRASAPPVSTKSGPISPLEERIRVLGTNPSVPGRTVTVGMQARITVSEGPVTEGLKTARFAELDELRAAALGGTGRAAVLPEVTQPAWTRAREGSTQPSSGLVVEPSPGSSNLEVLAWNTGRRIGGSNVSHAERQFVEWFSSQNKKWLDRVKSVDVQVFGRDVCPGCTADLQSLQRWLRETYPGIEINWVRADSGRPFKPERARSPTGPN